MQKRSTVSQEEVGIVSEDWASFPIQLTSFVGREQEIAIVCTLLKRPEVRLLTLIGPGGVGKTRLSLQVAAHLAAESDGRICFISLMETSDPEFVIPTIAKALGLQKREIQPTLEFLKAFFKEKHLLLVLDNFEQVIDAAPTLASLLGGCSDLKILTTSRAALRISGEYLFYVPPLTLPNARQLPGNDELLQYSAIALFLERAHMIGAALSLNKENSRIIAEICIHLDGLPLAIEMAVPHLRLLSLQTLLERLDHRFQLLISGMRDAPGRHQTLQHTLEWSYRLLNPHEQQLFRFLSIFASGCTLQAIEATWNLARYQQEKKLLLESVTSLLDKSMLSRSTQEPEEPRLLLLRTMREYGLQLLVLTGELVQAQWAHATYYLALVEEAEQKLKGPHLRLWQDRLLQEHNNLHEALCFLLACDGSEADKAAEMALRLGKALEHFRFSGGHAKEECDLFEHTVKRNSGIVDEQPATSMLSPRLLYATLTQREREIVHLVAQGLTDVQVAERLIISHRTVNFHLTSIYRKLQVSSRNAATRYMLEFQHL